MKPRSARLLPLARLAKLTTARLLAYRDSLLALEESLGSSDWDRADVEGQDADLVFFKDDPRWMVAYAELKRVLSEREHVER